jgi:hypothetical protein
MAGNLPRTVPTRRAIRWLSRRRAPEAWCDRGTRYEDTADEAPGRGRRGRRGEAAGSIVRQSRLRAEAFAGGVYGPVAPIR